MGRLRVGVFRVRRWWPAVALAVLGGLSAVLLARQGVGVGPLTGMALPVSVAMLCAATTLRRRRATELAIGAGRRRRCAPAKNPR